MRDYCDVRNCNLARLLLSAQALPVKPTDQRLTSEGLLKRIEHQLDPGNACNRLEVRWQYALFTFQLWGCIANAKAGVNCWGTIILLSYQYYCICSSAKRASSSTEERFCVAYAEKKYEYGVATVACHEPLSQTTRTTRQDRGLHGVFSHTSPGHLSTPLGRRLATRFFS